MSAYSSRQFPLWARSGSGGGMKAVVETIELPMAGQESEPAIFLGEANVGLGRSTDGGDCFGSN